ncbi:uncharacterized protein LOC126176876 [Schistocerca cancellata]|uniref:uncharacterized protein LOC126176876 n=1 Tax=Schistocerca cancellata TaxID=274614 RepID=UPI0021194B08|nr:uncharacterized protein LOC126176876 [Schistocerca cancellata]
MYFETVYGFMIFYFCIEKVTALSYRPINWSKAPIKSIYNKERMRYHPAYNEAIPALCDLTENCDICCSDPDCSQRDKEVFICTSNNEVQSDYDSLACEKHHLHSLHNGWFHLLCYVTANSPYLGQYFIEMKKIVSLPVLNALVEQKERKNSFYNDANLPSDAVIRNSQYIYGEPIKLIWNIGSDFSLRYSSYFELPQNLLSMGSGSCVLSQEVKYLVNSNATCVRKISKETCNNNISSYLSVAPYALLGDEDFFTIQLPAVAKGKFSTDSTETRTKYVCLKNGSDYVTFSKNIFMKAAAESDYQVSDDSNTTDCEDVNDQLLSTFYNDSINVCGNVLVSVDYNFIWKGSEIVMLNVVYMLTDVFLPEISMGRGRKAPAEGVGTTNINSPILSDTIELYVTQYFSVSYHYYSYNSSAYNETETD